MRADGYGLIWHEDRVQSVHLVSLAIHGVEVPEGMVADHQCRNRCCVNPAHLRIVTPAVNALENNDSVFAINSRKTHCIHGHPLYGENLAIVKAGRYGGPTRACITCNPMLWTRCIVPREPPDGHKPKWARWIGPFQAGDPPLRKRKAA